MNMIERIERRLSAVGKKPFAASVEAGLGPDAIRNLQRSSKRKPNASLSLESVKALAPVLRTSVSWLISEEGPEEMQHIGEGGSQAEQSDLARATLDKVEPKAALPMATFAQMPQDLPVLGVAAGSAVMQNDGFELEARVIEYVRRPPGVQTVPDAYAIYVTGSSMSPQHNDGEMRVVHPGKPPRIGDSVVIQAATGPNEPTVGYIAKLVKRTGNRIVVEKLNPPCEMTFNAEHVAAMHRILTVNEMLGI